MFILWVISATFKPINNRFEIGFIIGAFIELGLFFLASNRAANTYARMFGIIQRRMPVSDISEILEKELWHKARLVKYEVEASLILQKVGVDGLSRTTHSYHCRPRGIGPDRDFEEVSRHISESIRERQDNFYSLYDDMMGMRDFLVPPNLRPFYELKLKARNWKEYAGEPDISEEIETLMAQKKA